MGPDPYRRPGTSTWDEDMEPPVRLPYGGVCPNPRPFGGLRAGSAVYEFAPQCTQPSPIVHSRYGSVHSRLSPVAVNAAATTGTKIGIFRAAPIGTPTPSALWKGAPIHVKPVGPVQRSAIRKTVMNPYAEVKIWKLREERLRCQTERCMPSLVLAARNRVDRILAALSGHRSCAD
jgi:hypothetical protein